MENVLIQKIFKLTEQILRGEFEVLRMKEELENHLKKAQQMGSIRYEAEVLNTLSILSGMKGDHQQSQRYLHDALDKVSRLDHIDVDLKIKLLSNMTEECLFTWDLDQANLYVDEGIALGKQQGINILGMLYLYGNKINYLITRGKFSEGANLQSEAWKIAEDTQLLQYSKFEYFQIIFQLRNSKAMIEMALGQCEVALETLRIAAALVQSTNNPEHRISAHLSQMYYDLLCKGDESAARESEQKALEASGGSWPFSTAMNIALFMLHNHKPDWARRFAQIAQDTATPDRPLPQAAAHQIERIVKGVY